jgi:hypothetical protein
MRKPPLSLQSVCLDLILILFFSTISSGTTYQKCASIDSLTPVTTIAKAFADKQSNIQVKQKGVITRILSDDTVGDRHQRLIIRLSNNQTLLITHNIDLAPRVPNPVVGKTLTFYGEYEWNDEGGVVHWTHKDPDGSHVAGWLEYEGKRYSILTSNVLMSEKCNTPHFSKQLSFDRHQTSGYSQFTLSGRYIHPRSSLSKNNYHYFIINR